MLSLPCFPSGDSPVHMYYVHVFSALLSHSNAQYAHFFRIRHLFPPYALYYYALLGLSRFVPMFLADRLIICAYFVSFVFGFRYLARALGPSADRMTLLAVLLLLNWPLGMGFVNFCLSLSLSFWAAGIWLRLLGRRNLRRRFLFLLLVTAIMFTHPVPLLLLLIVAAAVLLSRIIISSRQAGRLTRPDHFGADLITLALASLNMAYVKLFTASNPLKQVAQPGAQPAPYWHETLERAGIYAHEHALPVILGHGAAILLYRAGLLLILAVPLCLAVRQRLRNQAAGLWTVADTFLLLGGALFLGLPFIPSQLNGLYYFADRLVLCAWLVFLFAASGWTPTWEPGAGPSRASRGAALVPWVCVLFALVCNTALLVGIDRILRPVAQDIASLEQTTVWPTGQIGFALEDPRQPVGSHPQSLSWGPYYWALLHVFRHNNAVLANAPWMHESILPVAPSSALPEVSIPALQEPLPDKVQDALLNSPADLRKALAAATFFAVDQIGRPPLASPEPLLSGQGSGAVPWTCRTYRWYRICSRAPVRVQNAR